MTTIMMLLKKYNTLVQMEFFEHNLVIKSRKTKKLVANAAIEDNIKVMLKYYIKGNFLPLDAKNCMHDDNNIDILEVDSDDFKLPADSHSYF